MYICIYVNLLVVNVLIVLISLISNFTRKTRVSHGVRHTVLYSSCTPKINMINTFLHHKTAKKENSPLKSSPYLQLPNQLQDDCLQSSQNHFDQTRKHLNNTSVYTVGFPENYHDKSL